MTREREIGTVRGNLEEGDERQKLRQSIIWPLCIPIFYILFKKKKNSVIIHCLLAM